MASPASLPNPTSRRLVDASGQLVEEPPVLRRQAGTRPDRVPTSMSPLFALGSARSKPHDHWGLLCSCGRPAGAVLGCDASRHIPPTGHQLAAGAVPYPLPRALRPAMRLTSPSASGGSVCSGSARPSNGSWTAGTIRRASQGSAATVIRGIQCANPECKADYFRPFSCKVFYPLGGPLHRLSQGPARLLPLRQEALWRDQQAHLPHNPGLLQLGCRRRMPPPERAALPVFRINENRAGVVRNPRQGPCGPLQVPLNAGCV